MPGQYRGISQWPLEQLSGSNPEGKLLRYNFSYLRSQYGMDQPDTWKLNTQTIEQSDVLINNNMLGVASDFISHIPSSMEVTFVNKQDKDKYELRVVKEMSEY